MTIISRNALLPYTSQQIFDLVNDVEAYPEYMDGCVGTQVLRRTDTVLEARLDLARGGLKQSITTRNRMVAGECIILELVDGPFNFFEGRWEFVQLGDAACKVSLHLEFTAGNAVVGVAAAKLFDRVTNNLVDALGRRAKQIYG